MQTSQNPEPFITRVETYENHLGHRIFERIVVSGSVPVGFHRFIGVGQLNVQDTPVGPIRQAYNFAIEADTIDRAFSLFEAAAQAEGKAVFGRIMADIRSQMSAVQVAPKEALRLLDPSGNPLQKPR